MNKQELEELRENLQVIRQCIAGWATDQILSTGSSYKIIKQNVENALDICANERNARIVYGNYFDEDTLNQIYTEYDHRDLD